MPDNIKFKMEKILDKQNNFKNEKGNPLIYFHYDAGCTK